MNEQERLALLNALQDEGVNAWKKTGKGILRWFTGIGKTWGFYKCYLKATAKHPGLKINIVVPSINLKEDWERTIPIKDDRGRILKDVGYIKKWNLQNVEVYVLNSYITKYRYCDMLVVDEIHHVLGKDAKYFNQCIDVTNYKYFLGLTATLTEAEEEYVGKYGLKVVHTITKEQSKSLGLTAKTIEFNVAVKLNKQNLEEYTKYSELHDKNLRHFLVDDVFDFDLARTCTADIRVCRKLAAYKGWSENDGEDHEDSPTNIKKYATMWHMGMTKRKEFLIKSPEKLVCILYLLAKFKGRKVITFGESKEFADEITKAINQALPGRARSYHSDVKGEIRYTGTKSAKIGAKRVREESLALFYSDKVDILNTVKALDEGADVPAIEIVIIYAGTGKDRQQTQREGRGIRFVVGKTCLIINLYISDTQDEKWLRSRQTSKDVIWVNDVAEVDYDYDSTKNEQPISRNKFKINRQGGKW